MTYANRSRYGSRTVSNEASDKQVAFVRRLLGEVEAAQALLTEADAQAIAPIHAHVLAVLNGNGTKAQASAVIDVLLPLTQALSLRHRQANPSEQDAEVAALATWAAAQPGDFFQSVARQWAQRGTLSERQVEALRRAHDKAQAPKVDITDTLAAVADGHYAIPSKTGHNDLDFFVVKTNKGFYEPARKGQRYIRRFVGGQGEVKMFGNEQGIVAQALAALTEDERKQAMATFGQQVGTCGKCGRSLTDETSRHIGIGPECRKGW